MIATFANETAGLCGRLLKVILSTLGERATCSARYPRRRPQALRSKLSNAVKTVELAITSHQAFATLSECSLYFLRELKARKAMKHLRDKILGTVSGSHFLALLDQAVISGLAFVTVIMVGRWTNPAELGLYAIGFSILLSFLTVQWTLISIPYMTQSRSPLGTPAEHAGGALVQCGLLLMLTTSVFALAALGLAVNGTKPELAALAWTLAGVAPFVLLREFCRSFSFAHLQPGRALGLDIAVAAIQLGTLSWLGWTGKLSSNAAYAVIGVACALPTILWLYLARADFVIRIGFLPATMKRSWTLGKWMFGYHLSSALQLYFSYWLLAWLAGTKATGLFAASMSVATLTNPLVLGLGNILIPRAILAFKDGSITRLWREVALDLLLRAAPVGVFCLVVVFAGEDLLHLFYHSNDYMGQGLTATILTFSVLAFVIGCPAHNALISMEHSREVFRAELLASTLAVALAWLLLARGWGVLGVAYAQLAGHVARATGWWIGFLVLAASDKFAKTEANSSSEIKGSASVPGC